MEKVFSHSRLSPLSSALVSTQELESPDSYHKQKGARIAYPTDIKETFPFKQLFSLFMKIDTSVLLSQIYFMLSALFRYFENNNSCVIKATIHALRSARIIYHLS